MEKNNYTSIENIISIAKKARRIDIFFIIRNFKG
jgi:hypothetical protein